jgi:glycerol uptake facilitator protein
MPGDYGWVNTYFWVPIVAPLIGAALAVPAYDIGVRKILIARKEAGEAAEAGRVPGEGAPPGTLGT